ncbi:hypothetical protein E4T47_09365 [Aureobasidium subglaciale]|nr:hypothetical protein E4T43_06975 [Aureobasidium subglaciale]KAI5261991.1 hypothetical protein E4T47_09365 [Aureobasidium subglaciale]
MCEICSMDNKSMLGERWGGKQLDQSALNSTGTTRKMLQSMPPIIADESGSNDHNLCDLEKSSSHDYMTNSDVDELRWTNISVAVTDKNTKQPKLLLSSVSGDLKAGECYSSRATTIRLT